MLSGCIAAEGVSNDKDAEHEWAHGENHALSSTESRRMLFEGSCEFLACCAKGDCSLPDADVTGACGSGCNDAVPWIARPDRDFRYGCGECVEVCVQGTDNCAEATVWDNSITDASIEGNVALFDALGLGYSDNPSACTGTGEVWVDVSPCGAEEPPPLPAPRPDPEDEEEPPADEPPADEPPADEPPADEPPADEPPADEPDRDCTCATSCGYCWCGTPRERACAEAWLGTGDGCDCGCQWDDPDCDAGSEPEPAPEPDPEPAPEPEPDPGTFAGVYCTDPGHGCGGNEPCWPYYDCPADSSCDWSAGSWGRCME